LVRITSRAVEHFFAPFAAFLANFAVKGFFHADSERSKQLTAKDAKMRKVRREIGLDRVPSFRTQLSPALLQFSVRPLS